MFSPMKRFGIMKPFGYTSFEAGELLREIADRVTDIDPLFGLVDVNVAQPVRLDDVDLLVLALAEVGVDHDGAVVTRMNQARIVAVRASTP